ncbi:MAG: mechanosensitive ion channel protein MscS [Saprospiraceae bacterium]|nr:MAG: mechanosensitive ion channel protein MscS [Saprospiraceae bacterium]
MNLKEILEYNLLSVGGYHLSLLDFIEAFFIIMVSRSLLWFLTTILKRVFTSRSIDPGRQYAFQQFLKYIIYTFTFLLVVQAFGVNLSLLWAGSAALLVGIGLGLQEMFTNLISGIILLIEGTVEVGDIVNVDGMIGKVVKIGFRTCDVETRDSIVIIVPNSKLVTDKVTNWSHNRTPTRFHIHVGVAYSSDVDQITDLLIQAAKAHKDILKAPEPAVNFEDFGESSLNFDLQFYSNEYWRIERVKSEVRYNINRLFRENKVEIPFPQRDLWIRGGLRKEDSEEAGN